MLKKGWSKLKHATKHPYLSLILQQQKSFWTKIINLIVKRVLKSLFHKKTFMIYTGKSYGPYQCAKFKKRKSMDGNISP